MRIPAKAREVGAALLAALALMPSAASAQVPADAWKFGAQLYLYLPKLEGTANIPGSGVTPDVSVDVEQILGNLEFGFMGSFEAKRGKWGAFSDFLYLSVGSESSDSRNFSVGGIGVPGTASATIETDLKGWVLTFAGEYAVVAKPAIALDVFVGARIVDVEPQVDWTLQGNIGGIPAPGRSGSSSVSGTNWDGIVGAKGRWRFGAEHRWFVPYYVDIGTGESDLTWQAMAGLGYSWESIDLFAAWRYLDYDMGAKDPFADLSTSGPLISLVYRWESD